MVSMKRVNNICRHLVGTKNSMQSAMKEQELFNPEYYNAVIDIIFRNIETGKWERRDEKTRISSSERSQA